MLIALRDPETHPRRRTALRSRPSRRTGRSNRSLSGSQSTSASGSQTVWPTWSRSRRSTASTATRTMAKGGWTRASWSVEGRPTAALLHLAVAAKILLHSMLRYSRQLPTSMQRDWSSSSPSTLANYSTRKRKIERRRARLGQVGRLGWLPAVLFVRLAPA